MQAKSSLAAHCCLWARTPGRNLAQWYLPSVGKFASSDWQARAPRSAGRPGWTEGCNEDIFSLLADLLQPTDLNSLFPSWQNEIQASRDQKHLLFIYLVIHKVPHHHGIWKPPMNRREFPGAKSLQSFLTAIKIASWEFLCIFFFLSPTQNFYPLQQIIVGIKGKIESTWQKALAAFAYTLGWLQRSSFWSKHLF